MTTLIIIGVVAVALWCVAVMFGGSHYPDGFGLELRRAHALVSGVDRSHDDVLLELGILRRAGVDPKTGMPVVVRPIIVGCVATHAYDAITFVPAPGSATAWENAVPELRHLFEADLELVTLGPAQLQVRVRHTADRDLTAQPFTLDEISDDGAGDVGR